MAANKIILNGEPIIDLTADTATAADVAQGKTFHLANGEQATGTASGGSGIVGEGKYLCTVYDYDGTILLRQKGNAGDTVNLPTAPEHERLIFQEWSTVKTITNNSIVFGNTDISVGAIYKTASGNTEFDIEITKLTGKTITFQNLTGMTSIIWGDGTTNSSLSHTYTNYGKYTIQIVGVTELGEYVLTQGFGASNINYSCTEVRLSDKITLISGYCFAVCYSLKNISFANGLTTINNAAFTTCYSLECIVMPSSIQSVGSNAFQNCYSLYLALLSTNLQVINSNTFSICYSLTKVALPKNLNSIQFNAFTSCYSVISYDFSECITVPINNDTNHFNNINSICKILVPDNLYDEWISATNWAAVADYIYKASEV